MIRTPSQRPPHGGIDYVLEGARVGRRAIAITINISCSRYIRPPSKDTVATPATWWYRLCIGGRPGRAPQYRDHHQYFLFTLYAAAGPAALQRHRRNARHIVVPIMYWRAPGSGAAISPITNNISGSRHTRRPDRPPSKDIVVGPTTSHHRIFIGGRRDIAITIDIPGSRNIKRPIGYLRNLSPMPMRTSIRTRAIMVHSKASERR